MTKLVAAFSCPFCGFHEPLTRFRMDKVKEQWAEAEKKHDARSACPANNTASTRNSYRNMKEKETNG